MNNTKKITFCAIMSALSAVIMLVSYFPYLTYAVPAVAGLCIMVVVVEFGCKWAVFSYLTAAFLTFLFAETESKILFILFFGFYPIVKCLIEKLDKRIFEWVLKFFVFNLCVVSAYFIFSEVFMLSTEELGVFAKYGALIMLILSNLVFICYDLAVARMSAFYVYSLQPRISRLLK